MAKAAGCIRPSGKDAAGCLSIPFLTTDATTHEPVKMWLVSVECDEQYKRKLIKHDDFCSSSISGIADATGRMVVAPRPNIVAMLSTRLAFVAGYNGASPTLIDLRTGTQRSFAHQHFEWAWVGGGDLLFAVEPGANGRSDYILINSDGSDGVRFTGGTKPVPIGNFMITTATDAAGNRSTAWMDATGAVKFATGEVYKLPWNNRRFADDWVRTIGEMPLKIDGETRPLLLPLDNSGVPIPLPEGLAGVSPYLSRDKIDTNADNATPWLLTGTDGSVRFVRAGALKDVLPHWQDYPLIDAFEGVGSTLLYADDGKPAWGITAHLPGKGWMSVGYIGTTAHEVWATPSLAMDARVVAYNKFTAAETERLRKAAAEAEAQRLAAEKSRADALSFLQSRAPSGADYRALYNAARLVDGPVGDGFGVQILQAKGLITVGISGEDSYGNVATDWDWWCRLGPRTCDLAKELVVKKQAARDAQHKAQADYRAQWAIPPYRPSDDRFSVRVYEKNGSYHDENWDQRHYEVMTGQRSL